MRFHGSVFENLFGHFLAENGDSIAILVQIFSILMLDQFSRRRKMRIDYAHLQLKIKKSTKKYFILKVMTVLSWKITNIANFPT